jgi:hypothetical protein
MLDRCMWWTIAFFTVWASSLAAGIGAAVGARRRPALSKKLLLVPASAAGLIVVREVFSTLQYIRHIPLDTQADHARLQGYLTATALYTLLFVGPLVGTCILGIRRLRAG